MASNFLSSIVGAFANSNPIGAAVGAGANMLGSIFQNAANKKAASVAFERQRQLMAEQNAYNTNMWHMSNAYNSPSAQMARFKQAGLNPNLIYGEMSDTSSSPMSSASPSAPGFAHAENVAGSLNPLTAAQVRLANAQADKLNVETTREFTFARFDEQLLSGEVEYLGVKILGQKAVNELTHEEKLNIYQQTKNLGKQFDLLDKQVDMAEYDVLMKAVDWNLHQQFKGAELTKLQHEARKAGFEADTFMLSFFSMIALNSSKIRLNEEERKVASERASNLEKLGISYDKENEMLQVNLDIAKDYAEIQVIMDLIAAGAGIVADIGGLLAKGIGSKFNAPKRKVSTVSQTFKGRSSSTTYTRHEYE